MFSLGKNLDSFFYKYLLVPSGTCFTNKFFLPIFTSFGNIRYRRPPTFNSNSLRNSQYDSYCTECHKTNNFVRKIRLLPFGYTGGFKNHESV